MHQWLLSATDEQILALVDFAKSHNMKLDYEIEAVLQPNQTACPHIEGFVYSGELAQELAILKRLNVKIDIVNMDGPLWTGHYSTTPSSCALSVSDLAANVASNLAQIIAQYPAAQVYEIEPDPALTTFPDWRESLNNFQVGVAQGLGRPIRGMFLDVTWDTKAWLRPLEDLRAYTRERNMLFGWFFDGSPYSMNDAQWLNSAAANFEYVEGTVGIIPDIGIVASWNAYPAENMPDTWPVGLTSLINHYFRRRTRLEVQFMGQGAQGWLTTVDDGKPLPNVTVSAFTPGADFSQPLPTSVIQGVVPPTAAWGQIGYRLNAECTCAGMNDVLVGALHFQETQGGSANFTYLLPDFDQNYNGVLVTNEKIGGTIVNRVIATTTQSFLPNSSGFPVDPGAQFSFTIPAATVGGDGWYGQIMLAWYDRNFNILPGGIVFVPPVGQKLTSAAITAADGTFALPKLPRVGPGSAPVFVQYPGDTTHRPVTWILSR